jgi:predicted metalloprotease with PDZ domain
MIRAAALLALCVLPALASAADRCDVEYRFTARWDETPRRFDVDLLFDAGKRTSTELGIADEWGAVKDFGRAIRRVRPIAPAAVVSHDAGRATTWTVDHPAGARVHVRYEMRNDVANVDDATPLSHVDFYRTMLGATWFQFYGNGGLLIPQDIADRPLSACLTFSGLRREWAFASSHGEGRRQGDAIEIRTRTSLGKLDSAVFLGGDFRLYRRPMDGGALVVAMRGDWPFTDAKFVDTTARVMREHRAFWPDRIAHYLVSFIPNRTKLWNSGGTGLYHSFALHASDDFTVPGSTFDHLIGHEDIHTWVPHRLGTTGDDEAAQYWFSEGFTDYLTHRLLVTAGVWSLDDFARQLDSRILLYEHSPYRDATNAALARDFWKNGIAERMPYVRGELLALRWDKALLARGETLQQVLRSLLLPDEAVEDDARNRPDRLAARRLVSALRSRLGPSLDRDIAEFVDEGRTIAFTDDFLGPCFSGKKVSAPAFELGFDVSTLQSHVLAGVVPGSAAERAGLRDGMRLAEFSIQYDTVDGNVEVRVVDGDQLRTIRYVPRGDRKIELHEYAPLPGAAQDPACRAWIAAR